MLADHNIQTKPFYSSNDTLRRATTRKISILSISSFALVAYIALMLRTDSSHKDFIALVKLLDADLAARDGEDHAFYASFNSIEALKHVLVVYDNDKPIACGAMKPFGEDAIEIKRMYVVQYFRGTGMATAVLQELETWARDLGFAKCILETGRRQPEAVALYRKNGYLMMDNYGPYAEVENSVCFAKSLD
ncbi:MAG: putative acetyltransferase [Flavobacteriales bacterium]|jgi:putative acetyltransferase